MEKRKTGAGGRWAKGRRREPEKGPSLSAWLRCYAIGRGGSETRTGSARGPAGRAGSACGRAEKKNEGLRLKRGSNDASGY